MSRHVRFPTMWYVYFSPVINGFLKILLILISLHSIYILITDTVWVLCFRGLQLSEVQAVYRGHFEISNHLGSKTAKYSLHIFYTYNYWLQWGKLTASVNITFKGRQIHMATEIEVKNCFVICRNMTSFMNDNFLLEVMFNLKTFSQGLATVKLILM